MKKEQQLFYYGKRRIARLDRKEAAGEKLTEEERLERDEIKQVLFESVFRFGVSLARQRLGKYRKDSDAFPDIQQSLAVIFYERLPYYDPTKSMPTTYFLRYFNQAITEYILKYSQHMSQYDAHNVALVRGAIRYYEERGIKWDEPMIVTKTGLSPKVVKYTIHLASNSIWANVDDENMNMPSKEPTPEEDYINNEKTETIYNVLRESLTPEELDFFLYKVNLDGKERSYQQVADELGMPVRDVKMKWSGIIARLNSNRDLQSYNHNRKQDGEITVSLHKSTPTEMDENLFLSALDSVNLHND